jgi:hypothetical protein
MEIDKFLEIYNLPRLFEEKKKKTECTNKKRLNE